MEDTGGEGKSKRQCRDKSYKAKAFEKFKQLKSGARSKYEIEEIENVYETVDEKEYVKRIHETQDDDWIVDDDGSGYVEDGRDIFDDDLDEESIKKAQKQGSSKGTKKKKALSNNTNKGNLKYMLSNISGKKKEETQLQDDDNMLSEILGEIDEGPSTSKAVKIEKKPFVPRKVIAQNYFKKFDIKSQSSAKPIDVVKEEQGREPHDNLSDSEEDIDTQSEQVVSIEPKVKNEVEIPNVSSDYVEDGPKLKKTKPEPTPATLDVDLDEFDDDFDEAAMLKIDESQFFGVNMPNTTESEVMEVDAPFENTQDDNKEVFRFFWWDAFEDPEKQPGTVFLFGKTYSKDTKSYVSCCVAVKNIMRQIFVLPRPFMLDDSGKPTDNPVGFKDLYLEFSTAIAEPMRLKSFKAKLVKKKYAFNPLVPKESDYLEVRYPANEPKVNFNVITREPKSFSQIFGIDTSSLERFLLDAKLKGPCWLEVKTPEFNKNPLSWCTYEVNCPSVSSLVKVETDIPAPPLVIATINFRFHVNPRTNQNEITMATCMSHSYYDVNKPPPNGSYNQHFCVIAPPAKQILPPNLYASLQNFKLTKVQKMGSEKALLNYFITQFSKIDPDVVVGHDLRGLQIDVLANRLSYLDVASFSKFSRLKRTMKKHLANELFTGRLVADTKISSKELIKSRSYDLPSLCQQVLKIPEQQIIDLEPDEVPKLYETAEDLLKLVTYTMQDAHNILRILYDLNVLPLALEITRIAGNVMSRTLLGGRSERNEYLLLHAFNEKGYIVPDKRVRKKAEDGEKSNSKKKPTYSGGLVLDPKVGLYDKLVLVMDFNSLYPSIIQEFNICFTTILSATSPDGSSDSSEPGILPTEIRKLVESRRQVKQLMEVPDLAPDLKMRYNIRQMALKLTANSMYGCLGFSNSRFFAKKLAALVTEKGRDILMKTKSLVENAGLEVLYGDTDSIMINTNLMEYDEAMNLGKKVKQDVNKTYKTVELDIDGVFKYLLLLKKKKYAALTISKTKTGEVKTQVDYKGLDIVRRDWSKLACEAGKLVIDQIFRDQAEDDDRFGSIMRYLNKLQEDLKEHKVPVPLLVITKQLTKDPQMYATKDNLPHVQVAIRYNKEHGGHLRQGDTVPYVICDDGTNKSATQRAYHPEELKTNKNLKIDSHYYLAQQIHPVVTRICEPIEGLDAQLIAEYLGLDPTAYKRAPTEKTEDNVLHNCTSPVVKYRDAEKFSFICLHCKETNTISGVLRGNIPALIRCINPQCDSKPVDFLYYVENQLVSQVYHTIKKYYECKLICEDPACTCETSRMPLKFSGKYPVCPLCDKAVLFKEYSDRQLFYQLEYFSFIFSLDNSERVLTDKKTADAYDQLRNAVRNYIDHSAYSFVRFARLTALFGTKQEPEAEEVVVPQVDESDDFSLNIEDLDFFE